MFGVFSDGYNVTDHQYDATVLDVCRALVDESAGLDLLSVGLLGDGAKAFSTMAVPEWVDTAGGPIMPYLSSSTAFDGTMASGWYMGGIMQVCDNTARAARSQGEKSGRIYKVKHTKNSGLSISSAREALGLLDEYAAEITSDIAARVEYPVSEQEWSNVLDVLVPVPEVAAGGSTRGETMATNKRDILWDLWRTDDRVSPWRGTAQGVVQAFSTYAQHDAIVRGTNRVARNIENDIKGKFADIDESVMSTLTEVCQRDLVFA
jgi:phage/plasmid-like protein (TIGR03299 family)